MPKEFRLPDLGEGIAEAQVVRLLVKPGEQVKEDQYLMEVETDKAAVEIPSPYAGVAEKIHVQEGQTVNVGDVIVSFGEVGAKTDSGKSEKKEKEAESKPKAEQKQETAQTRAPVEREAPEAPESGGARRTTAPAAPVVRKLARELGVNIDDVSGSGPGGRVLKEDVEQYAEGNGRPAGRGDQDRGAGMPAPAKGRPTPRPAGPPPGEVSQDKWGTIRKAPINQIRKTIAIQMKRSAFTAVHVTHSDDVDITELDRARRELNEATGDDPKLTIMAFVIRAVCLALRKHPIFNASFDEENGDIIYKDYVNLGIAVDTERGLVVPVVRDADQLSMRGIAQALRQLAEKVRTNQFTVDELRGGTFTITNVGALGGTVSTPIINYPEVAILGLGRSRKMPVFRDGQVAEALMLPINLSFDHRATDGANAARFAGDIISYLTMPWRFLLD
ncbi:MAG: 2-oxo acid dehydrogenase subunit E2 [Phycisphaerae bacterium]|nr:2-oxo acid dehydrogenase subunit E2 [Phycisphaerae bacterium]